MKLATFSIEKHEFSIYGEYAIEIGNPSYPQFTNLRATILADGKEIPYHPTGATWVGREYDVEDMINSFLCSITQGDGSYGFIFLEQGLEKYIKEYITEDNVAVMYRDKCIYKVILGSCDNMLYAYDLLLVTDKYIYYAYGDMVLMLDTEEHGIISNNYFAEVGYWDSVENIASGEEMLVWGEVPEH